MNEKAQGRANGERAQTLEMVTLVGAAVILLTLVSSGCDRSSDSHLDVQSGPPSESTPRKAVVNHTNLPPCPPGDFPSPERGSPHTVDHRVVLSWNASVPRRNLKNEDIGYCLYRSKNHAVRKKQKDKGSHKSEKKFPCEECEQVNGFPVRETSCVDDIVEGDTLYYYVAIAVDKNGVSGFSNQAPAKIPGKGEPPASQSSDYTSCRAHDNEH
jgi:hypothetical protein